MALGTCFGDMTKEQALQSAELLARGDAALRLISRPPALANQTETSTQGDARGLQTPRATGVACRGGRGAFLVKRYFST
jgi:hypothetical protein